MSLDEVKWSCDYCTYQNYPNSIKCTMCQGTRTSQHIYRLGRRLGSAGSEDEGEDPSSSLPPTSTDLSLEPLRICEDEPPSTLNKWSCPACTYQNWPKANKCIMCATNKTTTVSQHTTAPVTTSPPPPPPAPDLNTNPLPCNRVRKAVEVEEDVDIGLWLRACLAVVQGEREPVEEYLTSGGSASRQLTQSDLAALDRPSAFDLGYTLVHLAIRFKREEILALLVGSLESSGSGLKRVPSYVAPDIAQSIRRHVATLLTNGNKLSNHCLLNAPYLTELNTFYLPHDIERLAVCVQRAVFSELLDEEAQAVLEGHQHPPPSINWSLEVTVELGSRLYALWNRSQGDCLLDSLMQAMWGVFDRDSLLRRALADTMRRSAHLLYGRWVESEGSEAKQLGFSVSESQRARDWQALVDEASQPGASLQQLHIFTLAHVLRRPIIVYGVRVVKSFRGEDLGYAGFQGVYLPLLWEVGFCWTSPLVLGYTRGHFSALVGMEPVRSSRPQDDTVINYLPLVDCEGKVLEVQFVSKAELVSAGNSERLLRQWLEVEVTRGGVLVALQRRTPPPTSTGGQGVHLLVDQMIHTWLHHYTSLPPQRSKCSVSERRNTGVEQEQELSTDPESDQE